MSDNDDVLDETFIAGELKKILEQELPPSTNKEERELYEEIERRIAAENEKLFADKNVSKKKVASIGLPVKAKLLAASSLAKSRAEMKAKKQDALAKAAAEAAKIEENQKFNLKGDEVAKKYRTSHDSIRKQLEEDGVFRKFHDSDSDSSGLEEVGVIDNSPLNKLKRSIRKAKTLSKFDKTGVNVRDEIENDDSDEDIRAVREESEAWLRKQKDLEKQLMAKASKGALKQRYMNKGAETYDDIPATEKRIDELLERVIKDSNLKIKGKIGFSKSQDKRMEGATNKGRTDMADIVKRALALRQEVEAATARDKSKTTSRKTAKKPFPVKLESSSSESQISESESSSDNDEASDTSMKRFDIPELDSMSDSSEDDNEKIEKFQKRSKPRFDFSKPSSFDLAEVDDVMAMEDAKRKLGKKPELWSSKPPGYKKFETKLSESKHKESNTKSKPALINTFPPEVEALRTKLAMGDFSLVNRDFLNSEKLLPNTKDVTPKTRSSVTNLSGKELPKTDVSKPTKDLTTNKIISSKKTVSKPPLRKEKLEVDPIKKITEKNKPTFDKKIVDTRQRRPSVGSGRTASKFI